MPVEPVTYLPDPVGVGQRDDYLLKEVSPGTVHVPDNHCLTPDDDIELIRGGGPIGYNYLVEGVWAVTEPMLEWEIIGIISHVSPENLFL
jgi:hypothetical protein